MYSSLLLKLVICFKPSLVYLKLLPAKKLLIHTKCLTLVLFYELRNPSQNATPPRAEVLSEICLLLSFSGSVIIKGYSGSWGSLFRHLCRRSVSYCTGLVTQITNGQTSLPKSQTVFGFVENFVF